jgi:hypothetical protein
MFFDSKVGNLSGSVVLLFIFSAAISMMLSRLLSKIFRANIWQQTLAELLLIIVFGFLIYKQTGKVVLHVPPKFQGYIFLVYSVHKKAPLQRTSFLKRHIEVLVPASGIIFTSSKRSGTLAVADSIDGDVKRVGNEIILPFAWDTLKCGTNAYFMDVLFLGPILPNWDYKSDSAQRNLRKEQICKLLAAQ